jgi:hypothetical protein
METATPSGLVVAVLPPANVPDAVQAVVALPAAGGRGAGRALAARAILWLRQVPADLPATLARRWPDLPIRLTTGGSADGFAQMLGATGVPATLLPEYVLAWQEDNGILLLPGVALDRQDAVRAALTPYLRTGSSLGTTGGPGPGPRTPEAPSFAFYATPPPAPVSPGGDTENTTEPSPDTTGRQPQAPPGPPFPPFPPIDLTIPPFNLPDKVVAPYPIGDLGMIENPVSEGTLPEADRPPAIPVVDRYASVQAPAMVLPQQIFALTVTLKQQAPPEAPNAPPLHAKLTRDAAGETGAPPVSVIIYATAFEVIGPARADLPVVEHADSPPASFQLRSRPGVTGEQQISITFLQATAILGRVVAKVKVGGTAPIVTYEVPIAGTDGEQGTGGDTVAPDVLLHIDRIVQDGRDHLHFQYSWPQNGELDYAEGGTIELNNVESWAQAQYANLSARARLPAPEGAAQEAPPGDGSGQGALTAAVRALEEIGENLYDMLFPPLLKDFYNRCAPQARTILIYSTEPWIPWEIIKPYGGGLADHDCDFLCARFQVARWLTLTNTRPNPLHRQVTMRTLCPVVPPSNLPAAQLESGYLTSLPARWPPLTLYNPLPHSADEVRAVMASGRVNLFHIATHGNFQVSDPTNAAIQIGTSQLTPASLTGNPLANGFAAEQPLVFINACHSGRQGLALSGLGGWVARVVQLGASGFIGTNWEVQDDLAAQFAIRFYDYLRMGSTFGAACRLARQEIRQANPGNSTWLAYVLYAHPLGTLQVPPA